MHRCVDCNLTVALLLGIVVIQCHLGGQLHVQFFLEHSYCSKKTQLSAKGLIICQDCTVQIVLTLYRQLPNMSTSSAMHQKKVDAPVRILKTTTGLRIPQAMILAGFLKSNAANKIVRQAVRRCKQQLESNARRI